MTTLSADGSIGYGVPWDENAIYRWSLPGGAPVRQTVPLDGLDFEPYDVSTDATGRRLLVYANSPTLAQEGLFLYDAATGAPGVDVAAGLSSGWAQSRQGSMTPDGRRVVYVHYDNADPAWPRQQVVLHDAASRSNEIVSRAGDGSLANADASLPSVSPSGRFVTFRSAATNLVPGATTAVVRLYLVDRKEHTTTALTELARSSVGVAPVDDDGRVVFMNAGDVEFQGTRYLMTVLYEWNGNVVRQIDLAADGSLPDSPVVFQAPRMSADGSAVMVLSWASNLTSTPNDGGGLLIRRPPATGNTTTGTTSTTTTASTSTTTSTTIVVTTTSTTTTASPTTTVQPTTTDGRRVDVAALVGVLRPAVRLG